MTDTPAWLQQGGLRVIERGLNQLLARDPETPRRLEPLVGQRLHVHLTDTPVSVSCRFEADGLRLGTVSPEAEPDDERSADATVRASIAGLTALAASRGRRSRDVSFEGDIGVVQEVKRLFGELEIDWEEQLSRLTGDVVAHQVGSAVRGGVSWGRHVGETFLRNLGEYVTEERRLLPGSLELADFGDDVAALRTAADRLEARLRRLERHYGRGRGEG